MLENFYPEIVITIFALAVLLADLFLKMERKLLLGYLSLGGVALALIALLRQVSLAVSAYPSGKYESVFLDGLIYNDIFALFFKAVFLLVALFVVLASINYTREDRYKGEYYSLILLATLGMMLVSMSGDLILLFVSFELASISTYALTAFRKDKANTEAAMKYFVIGALSSGIIVFALSLLYGIAGTTNIYEISTALHKGSGFDAAIFLSVVLVIVGFGYKVAAFPFHMWAPDTYQGAPSTISAYLSAATKKMGFVALTRILTIALPAFVKEWSIIIAVLAVLTMSVGNFAALRQDNIKRMLAYSSVAQAGYLLIGLALLSSKAPNIHILAIAAALMHVLTHALMKGGAFIAVGSASSLGVGQNIESYSGLGKRMPLTAFALAVFLLSLAGIPFFAGFISKFMLLAASVQADMPYLWLGVFLVLNSVASLYYYGRVIKIMYFEEVEAERLKEPSLMTLSLLALALLVILVGVAPERFIQFSMFGAKTLFAPAL